MSPRGVGDISLSVGGLFCGREWTGVIRLIECVWCRLTGRAGLCLATARGRAKWVKVLGHSPSQELEDSKSRPYFVDWAGAFLMWAIPCREDQTWV